MVATEDGPANGRHPTVRVLTSVPRRAECSPAGTFTRPTPIHYQGVIMLSWQWDTLPPRVKQLNMYRSIYQSHVMFEENLVI